MPAQRALFVGALCIILSMYGGGFATVPAYLADIFGTKFVGAIHGRLLTAWSLAGVGRVGGHCARPRRNRSPTSRAERTQVYDAVLYIMVGILALGFICNLLVRPVDAKWLMRKEGAADVARRALQRCRPPPRASAAAACPAPHWCRGSSSPIPVAWGLYKALLSAAKILS